MTDEGALRHRTQLSRGSWLMASEADRRSEAPSSDGENDKAARFRRDAIEMMANVEHTTDTLPSVAELCATMALAPEDEALQLSSLVTLRQHPLQTLQEPISLGELTRSNSARLSSSNKANLSTPNRASRSSSRENSCSLKATACEGSCASSGSPADQSTTPLGSSSAPDQTICDAVLSAMLAWPKNAEMQEQGCSLISLLTTDFREIKPQISRGRVQIKRKSNSRKSSGDLSAKSERKSSGESGKPPEMVQRVISCHDVNSHANLLRIRDHMLHAGAPSVILAAMKEHSETTSVVYCCLVALMALCKGAGGASAKHQMAAAGGIELITSMLMRDHLPTILWVLGRFTLQGLIRGEPELRKRARAGLPKVGFRSLFMLTNSAFM
ncbi:MAG: hypothetical protein SGPRY_003412 [Prymnesium sp.]